MAAGQRMLGDTQFTEMYAMDFPSDSILMSHMGEGNWRLARDDRPVRLIKRPLGIGGLDDPPTFLFQYRTGPATLATLIALGGERFRLLVSEGEVLDTAELPNRRSYGTSPRPARALHEAGCRRRRLQVLTLDGKRGVAHVSELRSSSRWLSVPYPPQRRRVMPNSEGVVSFSSGVRTRSLAAPPPPSASRRCLSHQSSFGNLPPSRAVRRSTIHAHHAHG